MQGKRLRQTPYAHFRVIILLVEEEVHHDGLGSHEHGGESARGDDACGPSVSEFHTPVLHDVPAVVFRNVEVTVHADMQLEARVGAGDALEEAGHVDDAGHGVGLALLE